MPRANSGMTWIRQPHVTAFLADLARSADISHESLDRLPASRTREYVRGLLVEHGALDRRDELRARYTDWAKKALERLSDNEDREVIRRYVRWHHLRRMNEMTVSQGTFLRSKQTVTVAIDFLLWLRQRDTCLKALSQTDLDLWMATGTTTRGVVIRFLGWAIKMKLVAPDLTVARHRRGTSRRAPADEQDQALQRIVHAGELSPRDRFAAILILVFGQQIEKIARLTWSDVSINDDLVSITLGSINIALTSPLDEPLRLLASEPRQGLTAAHPATPWIFRGLSPGQHLHPDHLRKRVKRSSPSALPVWGLCTN
jgi:integrase